ncbi:MAG: prolyl oligopeptidase family serine peptidase [bacterium]|nr:prolyl oligopeptidase family serine peptidase [bacterium]
MRVLSSSGWFRILLSGVAGALLTGALAAQSDAVVELFTADKVTIDGRSYPYRLMLPPPAARHEPQPLVVFLHGAGERGDDNRRQLTWLPAVMARPNNRERLPCHLLAVQCPKGERWTEVPWGDTASKPMAARPGPALRAVMAATDEVLGRHRVDRARVYLTGLSMGGYGSWELAAREPDLFAAVLPVCGGGDERVVGRLVGLPLQVWHGADDKTVPPARSRTMVETLAGFGVPVDYRELAGVRHDSWKPAYGETGGLAWLFTQDQRQQQRGAFSAFAVLPAARREQRRDGEFALRSGARVRAADSAALPAARLLAHALASVGGPELPTGHGQARGGDVVFELVDAASASAPIELELGERLEVRAVSAVALRHGAALALQVLRTWPDWRCPRGRLEFDQPPGGRVVVGAGSLAWSGAQAMQLVRLVWEFGGNEIRGIDLQGFELATRGAVEAEALRYGVTVASQPATARESADPAVVIALERPFDLQQILARPCPKPSFFELRAPPGTPDRILRSLHGALPAAAERARGGRALPLGLVLSRLGALLRRSVLR